MIGMTNFELYFWRTTVEDPEPTVAPRFQVESSAFVIPTIGKYLEGTQDNYEKFLWKRFTLDHEKARSRLWGSLKASRKESSPFYEHLRSIVSEKELALQHEDLDRKFTGIIQVYLKEKETVRALNMAKSCIRSMDVSSNMSDLFDSYGSRGMSIQMEESHDERVRELEYEQMQIFEFMQMRKEAEKTIKPRSNDIMRKPAKRLMNEPIPSFSQSVHLFLSS